MSAAEASAGLHEGAALVVGPAVAWRDCADEIALGLVGDHLEHVGQVLAVDVEEAERGAERRDPPIGKEAAKQ
jgi:hypothetical protein